MSTETIESFLLSYQKLKENHDKGTKMFVEFCHYDSNGEPSLYIGSYTENIRLEYVESYGLLIVIFTKETTLTFSAKNYNTNLSDEAVVFSSMNDDETYCLINFG